MDAVVPDASASPPFVATSGSIAVRPLEALLHDNEDLIRRIRLGFGLDAEAFDAEVQPLVSRYAACVHDLPATRDAHFCCPGGLLRLGLEVAFFALQGTDAHIVFGRATISERRQIEPRWRLATFIAGLCGELHRALGPLTVTITESDLWPAYLLPLSAWLGERRATSYRIHWRAQSDECRSLGLLALHHVAPAATLQALHEPHGVIVPHLIASVGGLPLYREHNALDSVVQRSRALVIDRDLHQRSDAWDGGGGPQLTRYLVEALRCLMATHPHWKPNSAGSRTWFGRDGLFVLWPQATRELVRLLEASPVAGLTPDPDNLLKTLLAGDLLVLADGGGPTWQIRPPGSATTHAALRFTAPSLLLCDLAAEPTPLDLALIAPPSPRPRTAPVDVPSGTQLPLTPEAVDPHPSTSSKPKPWHLLAPMRLEPGVRSGLEDILKQGSQDEPGPIAIAEGLWIPLAAFEHRQVQPAAAIRALGELKMLHRHDGQLVVHRTVEGREVPGVTLLLVFIRGWADTG